MKVYFPEKKYFGKIIMLKMLSGPKCSYYLLSSELTDKPIRISEPVA